MAKKKEDEIENQETTETTPEVAQEVVVEQGVDLELETAGETTVQEVVAEETTVQEVATEVVAAPEVKTEKVRMSREVPASAELEIDTLEDDLDLIVEDDSHTTTAHDDFDWTRGKRDQFNYTADQTKQLLADYDATMSAVTASALIKGRVTAITGGDVILDINSKSDGLVSLSEFRDMPDLKEGDYVDVYVESQEDARGQLVLSRKKAKLLKAWDNIVDSYNNGTIIRGFVISKTKGGLIVDAGGLETFLPGSQIDIKPIIDYDQYVGKQMDFKVVKINEAIKNAVVSHKALIESDMAEQRDSIIAGLEKGQVLEGIVKNITDFGAFLDLGGVDGLLYITDISWGRINHPNEVLELNQKISVVVLDFDDNKKRISLGMKQLQSHPWDVLLADIVEGSKVKGKIANIEDYGAFLEINPGVEGLIHVSEVSWSNQPINAKEYFHLGQEFEAKVVTIDREDRKMSLSIKQLIEDPWTHVDDKFPVGSKHMAEVKNITQYGVFVELSDGIGGMVHISDLSWTKRYGHPAEFTKVGEKIEIVILEIDKDNRKLSLGHKQTQDNPWENFDSLFNEGSSHTGKIVRKDDRGAIVELEHGVEGFVPNKQLKKENGTMPEVGESLDLVVIEFSKDDKKVVLSHSRIADDHKREVEGAEKTEKENVEKETKKAVKATQEKVEKSTLGDLDALSALKDQLD
jgi:small subunit ribosomal protein S1